MNAYPRLDAEDYNKLGQPKREAVVAMVATVAADVWRYYQGTSLEGEEIEALRASLDHALPRPEKADVESHPDKGKGSSAKVGRVHEGARRPR
jgi:hypothetical protein